MSTSKAQKHFETFDTERALSELSTREQGLTFAEVRSRREAFGYNELPESSPDSVLLLFLRQFQSPLMWILVVAGCAALLLGELTDGLVILFVLLFNGIIGSIQEGRAQDALFALRSFTKTHALVRRDETESLVPSRELVPGDIVFLKEGDKIPADARILKSRDLQVDEAAMTGESRPVAKNDSVLPEPVSIQGQHNMVFKGTHVTTGSATIVVTATGLQTAIGAISEQIADLDGEIPLKRDIRNLARVLIIITVVISLGLFVAGIASGTPAREMLLVSISLFVSVIPEGLPVVLTLILATGVARMAKKKVLVKRLQAVEALGQAKVIAVDKTGTLTKNELVVQEVYLGNQEFQVTGEGYEPKGDLIKDEKKINIDDYPAFDSFMFATALSANAQVFSMIDEVSNTQSYQVSGDPTEAAMLVLGQKFGYDKQALLKKHKLVFEIPFNFKRKAYLNIHIVDNKHFVTETGAPEVILSHTKAIRMSDGTDIPCTEEEKKRIMARVEHMSERGLRVIAVAADSNGSSSYDADNISGLTLVGLCGMKDGLRKEVPEAMKLARGAGMRVVMITGDHRTTATAIAEEAGVYTSGDRVLTGTEIDTMSEQELEEAICNTTVFARVTPTHKLQIIEAFKRRGDIIAMTGDGVNDVPSLVAADLGVAMGKIGTEVTKEAGDLVLLDDNFGNIPRAVEEGRHIFVSVRKVLLYLLSTNLSEVLVIIAAISIALPLPFTPAQIIWLNLITDSFLVVALGLEPKQRGLLGREFQRRTRSLVDRSMFGRIMLMACVITLVTVVLFDRYLVEGFMVASTVALTTISVSQWWRVWAVRHEKISMFKLSPFTNMPLIYSTLLVIGLQLAAVYWPWLQGILQTTGLSLRDWGVILLASLAVPFAEEIRKVIARKKAEDHN